MFGTFVALALGQLLIGWAKIETVGPFNAIVALFVAALVMVRTTRAEPPRGPLRRPCLLVNSSVLRPWPWSAA